MALKGIMGNGGGMPIAGLKNPGLRKGKGGTGVIGPFSGMLLGYAHGTLYAPKVDGGIGGN